VRNYEALANVERAFRSLESVDLKVRPITHGSRVRHASFARTSSGGIMLHDAFT
jgi:hypothetical protein